MVGVGRLSAGFGVMRRASVKCTADSGQLNLEPRVSPAPRSAVLD